VVIFKIIILPVLLFCFIHLAVHGEQRQISVAFDSFWFLSSAVSVGITARVLASQAEAIVDR